MAHRALPTDRPAPQLPSEVPSQPWLALRHPYRPNQPCRARPTQQRSARPMWQHVTHKRSPALWHPDSPPCTVPCPPSAMQRLLSQPCRSLMYPATSRPPPPLDQLPTPSLPTMQLMRSLGPRLGNSPPRAQPPTAGSSALTPQTCTHVLPLSPGTTLSLLTQPLEPRPPFPTHCRHGMAAPAALHSPPTHCRHGGVSVA